MKTWPRLLTITCLLLCFGGAMQSVHAQTGLPVKISEFYAERHALDVHLVFVTIDELNNKSFLIQRSENGEVFETVGEVEGRTNSTEINSYEFTDRNAFESGVHKYYYRLCQVDIDGGFMLSRIVIAQGLPPAQPVSSLVIAPVPASDYVEVTYTSPITDQVTVELIDWSGCVLREASGKPGDVLRFDSLYELTTGPYLLRIMQADRLLIRQIYVD